MRPFTLLLLSLLISSAAVGQKKQYYWGEGSGKTPFYKYLTAEGGFGLRMYVGDIQQNGSLFNPMKLSYGLGLRYQWRPRVGFALNFSGRKYEGKAEHGVYPDAIDQMNGQLWDFQLQPQFSILKWEDFTKRSFTERDPVRKGNVYIGTGFGGAIFSSSYTSRTYKTSTLTDSLGNDSVVYLPIDMSGSGAGFGMYVPVSFGLRYRFNKQWSMGFEMQRQFYITKNIDGLATKKYDGMVRFKLRLAYSFGQDRKKADMGMTPNQKRRLKK